MARMVWLGWVALTFACGEEPSPPPPGACLSSEMSAPAMPAFCLYDRNPTSPTAGEPISPRDYLETVSGWYFGVAT